MKYVQVACTLFNFTVHLNFQMSICLISFTHKQVMITVLENLSDDPKIQVNHYWVFVANIKCRRFEVLDSMRTVVDKKLLQNAEKIRASFTTLWKEHYPTSRIKVDKFENQMGDIFAPKQTTK